MADSSNQTAIRSLGAQVANLAIAKAMAEQESADKDEIIAEIQDRMRSLQTALNRANEQLNAQANSDTVPGEVVPDEAHPS